MTRPDATANMRAAAYHQCQGAAWPDSCAILDRRQAIARTRRDTAMHDFIDTPYRRLIRDCEAAITRIRAAQHAGRFGAPEVGEDFVFVLHAVAPYFMGYARRVSDLGPESFAEALEALQDTLIDDILSPTYPTLATQFGAYLRTRPLRVLQEVARKHGRAGVSYAVARLDHSVGDEGQSLADTVADPRVRSLSDRLADREQIEAALAVLPPEERYVFTQRLVGTDNNAVARTLGVSAATATRIYQRAVVQLRELLTDNNEL
ncbi:MAG: hypothetical protein H7Z42_05840 [Roseiflexaceae bacterium]|nr:hypothetical protein [Roseiflexaceae bacterium]